ncbi:DNA-binding transcriptional MerR regulator [Caulobacter ginsengisoli]|uniref:DNA-binding transcriptional MerR regulator n=1 Tax=Caulobacter ginsengisoli TaxID=400775 RepID=A0ABU0IZC1_9CAUL|nr:MerR family transcriptional regulator [Caulobacter ginsengisoli]MDQ0466695.1 DNA-binding transcriptional MerR regulator [Caulobacter ginsengisoli]
MTASAENRIEYLNPAQAARRLGVSAKALRLYEQRGLVDPVRTAAGWRAYGPDQMARAAEIANLRALGLSLAQVARVIGGDPQDLAPALAAHQAALEDRLGKLSDAVAQVRDLRAALARGQTPTAGDLAGLVSPGLAVAFDLPWPWGGERFELSGIRPMTYITGPLGSGKTRLAQRLAETLPGGVFLGLDRALVGRADPVRVEATLAWLEEDGASRSEALTALVVALEAEGVLVVDLVEQGLDQAAQAALIAHLRRRGPAARPLFLMTRSNAILDLAAVGPDEAILFCPANHSPPTLVAPWPGAPGYEAVASCLASPEVRARTEGLIALRPDAA